MSSRAHAGGPPPRPDFLSRFLSAVPLLVVYFGLAALYAWQASRRPVPTIFTDELELTQLARSIAETGEPARRGEPYGLATLVAYALAPVWWLGSTTASWAAAKLILVLAMTATVFPAYGLARMVVPKWYALAAAGGSVAVPALAYSPILVEEPLAYPVSTTALWLIARALERPTWGRIAAALGDLASSRYSRERSSRSCSRCSRSGSSGSPGSPSPLGSGAPSGARGTGSARSPWRSASPSRSRQRWGTPRPRGETRCSSSRIGSSSTRVWAVGALAIGVGVLPVLVGVAALARPRSEERDPRHARVRHDERRRADRLRGLCGNQRAPTTRPSSRTLVVERNLIYLCPILFIATALAFARGVGRGLGDRGRRDLHAVRRHRRSAPARPVPVLRGARPLDRGVRESRARLVRRDDRGRARRRLRRRARRRRSR